MAVDPWASTNQGLNNLSNTFASLAQLRRQDQQQAKQNRLVDLQTKAAEQAVNDQTSLRTALAEAKGGYLYPEPAGVGPQLPGPRVGLSSLAPEAQPATADDRMAVMADLATRGNTAALELYGKTESLNEKLVAQKAQAEAYGDALGAAKAEINLKKMKAGGDALKGWMDVDPSGELARQQIAEHPDLFNGMDPSKMQIGDGKKTPPAFFPAADGGFTFYDGKEWKHVKKETPSADKFQLTEMPSADGKTAQKMRVNMTDGTMTPLGKPYAVKSQVPNVNITTKGGASPLAQTTFVDSASGQPLVFDKKTGTYSVATVNGATVAPKPSAMSPEAAGKAQMLEQGATYIPTLRAELFDEDGSVNQLNVANLAGRIWGTRGRELSSLMLDAVEAKLRAESGAAVPEPEVKRAAKRFMPQIGDTAAGIKIKLDNLETYLKGTSQKINNGRAKQPVQSTTKQAQSKKSGGYSDLLNKYKR